MTYPTDGYQVSVVTWEKGYPHYRVEAFDEELADAFLEALDMTPYARKCHVLADMVAVHLEGQGEQLEFFPGYNRALEELYEAAQRVCQGWEEHDRRLNSSLPKGSPS